MKVQSFLLVPLLFMLQYTASHAQSQNTERISDLERRVMELENTVNPVEGFLKTFGNLQGYWEWILAFVAAVAVIYGLWKRFLESKPIERLNKEIARIEDRQMNLTLEQEEKNRELINTVQRNIDSSTGLIGQFEQILKLPDLANEAKDALKLEIKETTARSRDRILKNLNEKGLVLSRELSRTSCAARGAQERLIRFGIQFEAARVEQSVTDADLNGAIFLALGRSFRIGDVPTRLQYLNTGLERASVEKSEFVEDLYPGIVKGDVRKIIAGIANDCAHQAGLLCYNVGSYAEAIESWQAALEWDETDFESALYIPEAKFLGRLAPTEKIAEEFEKVSDRIQRRRITDAASQQDRDQLLSACFVRWGNIYFGVSERKCHDMFVRAYERSETYLSVFSLAQIEWHIGDPNERCMRLFRQAFVLIQQKSSQTVEGRILMMLYYMMAICCYRGEIVGEIPQSYISLIFREASSLNNSGGVFVFSPVEKQAKLVSEFLSEVRAFQSKMGDLSTLS